MNFILQMFYTLPRNCRVAHAMRRLTFRMLGLDFPIPFKTCLLGARLVLLLSTGEKRLDSPRLMKLPCKESVCRPAKLPQ